MSDQLVEIDGSTLEGGGQILRMALTLSTLCRIPIRVINIRSGRSKPGLMAQHLKGFELVRDMSNAIAKGNYKGSTEIEYWPQCLNSGKYIADTETAGSIGLLLQVSLPCALFMKSDTMLTLRGGTNAEMAPQVDYTVEVFRPALEKFGASFDYNIFHRSYFPYGGGEVGFQVYPIKILNPVVLTNQGNLKTIYGWSYVAGTLPLHLANKMRVSAFKTLKNKFPSVAINIEHYKEDPSTSFGNCSGLILVAETTTGCKLGSSVIGKRNIAPEQSGQEAAEELASTILEGACVDRWCQDQIILFMALAKGKSEIRTGKITLHTQTAIFIAEKLTRAKFEIFNEGSTSIIKCEGIGLQNPY